MGESRVLYDRRFEDYRSMKQAYQHSRCVEFVITGDQATTAAAIAPLFQEVAIDYIGAEAQAYIRTEANDTAAQSGKYVYLEYQNEAGTILAPVTADLPATDTTTETAIGGTDFFRIRQLYSQVISSAAGGKAIVLTDDEMAGAGTDLWGHIQDNQTSFAVEQYYVPAVAQVPHTYLGRFEIWGTPDTTEATTVKTGTQIVITYTPKVVNLGEPQTAVALTTTLDFSDYIKWEPCIELEPATSVTFTIQWLFQAEQIHLELTFLEVYPAGSTPST